DSGLPRSRAWAKPSTGTHPFPTTTTPPASEPARNRTAAVLQCRAPMRSVPPLVLVTDRHATSGRTLVDGVAAAPAAGLPAVQLREKDLPGRPLLALAEQLRALTARVGALFLVNDRIDVAVAAGADGVHLGGGSLPVGVARRLLAAGALIG